MGFSRWEELQRIYHEACELPESERDAFLDSACADDAALRAEVASLLAGDIDGDDLFDRPAMEAALREVTLTGLDADELPPGSSIGPYRILAAIGRGGMGVVYRAEQQQPVRRLVALKVTRPGFDGRSVLERFQLERQTLAVMDHPAIARVFDAGATETGLPYFVMELVEGPPVTSYCERSGLDLRQRLALFIPICQAIQHAHQKRVIHRDIKPGNVLVATYDGRPAPKVIDFGIAKVMADNDGHAGFTQHGLLVGTPDYMSPEQVDNDIDTRSDIYALGVLLYELITGETPLGLQKLESHDTLDLLRRIREQDPPPPSARLGRSKAANEVRGELDWIVLKALEKDRSRRYDSVSGLIIDLEDYLRGAPVSAAPPSTFYRLRKTARRYRWPLATAAVLMLILAGATAFSARQAVLARRAERSAAAVSSFLRNDLLAQASASVQSFGGGRPDPDLKVRTALDRAASGVATRFGGEPLLEAAIRQTLASSYFDLGLYAEARHQVTRALELRRRELGGHDAETLASEQLLLNVDIGLGTTKDAAERARRLLQLHQRLQGPRHPDTLAVMETQAAVERALKHNAVSLGMLTELARLRREILGPEHPDTLRTLSNLGLTYMYQDQFSQAKETLSTVLAARSRMLGDEHPSTVESRNALALATMNTGQPEQAVALLTDVLAWRRRVLGRRHRETLVTLNSLGLATARQGLAGKAAAFFTECIAEATSGLGAHHPTAEACRRNLANTLADSERWADAVREYEAIVSHDVQQSGPESPDTLRDMSNLGEILCNAGRPAEGRAMLERVIALRRKVLGPKDAKTLSSMHSLAEMLWLGRRLEEARVLFEKTAALRREVLGPRNSRTLLTITSLAYVLLEQGRFAEAEPMLREALQAPPEDRWSHGLRCSLLGWSLAGRKRSAEAELLLREGYRELEESAQSRTIPERAEVERAHRRLTLLMP